MLKYLPISKAWGRTALLLVLSFTGTRVHAADAMPGVLDHPLAGVYSLLALALVQVVTILVVASAIRHLSDKEGILQRYLKERKEMGLPLFLIASTQPLAATVTVDDLMWMLIVVNAFLFLYMMLLIGTLRTLIRTMNGPREEEAPEPEADPVKDLNRVLTNAVPIEQEDEILLDHDYDGIKELDNVLPPWWLWMFYATIVFAFVYVLNYHVFRTAPLQAEEFAIEMAESKAAVEAYNARMGGLVSEQNVTRMDGEADLLAGKAIFTELCVACHGANGAGYPGSVGPNLTDAYWLHGGGIVNVFKTVKYGVPEKGMISWKAQLKPVQIQQVSSYILSLAGTVTEGGKEPQGEVWSGDGAAPPATEAATPDSAAVVEAIPE